MRLLSWITDGARFFVRLGHWLFAFVLGGVICAAATVVLIEFGAPVAHFLANAVRATFDAAALIAG